MRGDYYGKPEQRKVSEKNQGCGNDRKYGNVAIWHHRNNYRSGEYRI